MSIWSNLGPVSYTHLKAVAVIIMIVIVAMVATMILPAMV